MGGASSKGGAPAPTGGRPATAAAPEKPRGEPLVQQKFDRWYADQKSDPGFGADEEENQDAMLMQALKDDVRLFALFDGHGHEGKMVADAAKACVVEVLGEHLSSDKSQEGITAAFASLDKRLIASADADTVESGCSATLVVYDTASKGLLVANVGDTKAVIGSGSSTLGMQPKLVTEDHLPGIAAEKTRILAAGGQVRATDDVQLGELGGQRVWKGTTDKPGLPLSRSLGDTLAKECGVTAQPHITQVTLGAEDRFLVLASGGVWKVFSPNEVVDLVSQQPDAAAAADAVLKEASTRWEELWQGENTSVIVVVFPSC